MRVKVALHGFPAKTLKWVLPGLVSDWTLHRSVCAATYSMFIASWSQDGCQGTTSQHPKAASGAAWKEREEGNPFTPSFLSLGRKVFPETAQQVFPMSYWRELSHTVTPAAMGKPIPGTVTPRAYSFGYHLDVGRVPWKILNLTYVPTILTIP